MMVGMDLVARLRHRVGRRGSFLLFLAILDVVFAYYLLYPPHGYPPQPYPLLDVQAWGAWWGFTAFTCFVGAFMKSDRVPYAFAALLKTAWGLRYAYLWYSGGTPEPWAAMTVWLTFALTVVVISGWPEEIVRILPPRSKHEC